MKTENPILVELNGGPLDKRTYEISEGMSKQGLAMFREDGETMLYGRSRSFGTWHYIDANLIPDTIPVAGRFVMYSPTASQIRLHKLANAKALPALILSVEPDARIIAKVFTANVDFPIACGYHRKGAPGTWSFQDEKPVTRNFADLLTVF